MNNEISKGFWHTAAAYALWGVLPLYWKMMENIPAGEILAHRILWSFVFVFLIVVLKGRLSEFLKIASKREVLPALFLSSLLISANWFIYIWAVNHNRVIETSLGYYINPLISVILGMAILREKLNLTQWIAVLLAAAGVAVLALEYGKIPWIAVSLALTFGFYGLVKKLAPVDAITGLACETAVVTPVAFIYLLILQGQGSGTLGHASAVLAFCLVASGVATTLPLLWFAQGAKRIPLSMLGFVQYLSPTISLLLGVFWFKEPFAKTHIVSFAFIWCAIGLYTVSRFRFKMHLNKKA